MGSKVFLAMLFAAILCTGCVGVVDWSTASDSGTWQDDYSFNGEVVSIVGGNGAITVVVGDSPKVSVRADWTAKVDHYVFKPLVEEGEHRLSIASDGQDRDLAGVNFQVSVPPGVSLDLRSSNGRISVSGGELKSLQAYTSNGAVMVTSPGTGPLKVETSNGPARISDWKGEISCVTSNGAITAILPYIIRGDYLLSTTNGGISVSLSPASRFQLSAETSNGIIRNSLPGAWSEPPGGQEFSGAYNGGIGAQLTVTTTNSNIQLLPLE